MQGRRFQAVFESCKAFDKAVAVMGQLGLHGVPLMTAALRLEGPIKLNSQRTITERNEQDGVMKAIRNPEAHEPEIDWPMTREDALDVLSLLSYLYRKLENAAYHAGRQ